MPADNNKGFTILEVVIGVAIFMVGMLGVAGLQISAINAEAFSSRLTEATLLARATFEELMSAPYADDRLADSNFSGRVGGVVDGDPDYDNDPGMQTSKDAFVFANADNEHPDNDAGLGTNNIYSIAWNVCEDCLMDDTRTVRILVRWRVKDEIQTVDFFGVIPRK